MTTDMPKKIHQGKNIERFRKMLDISQDELADKLGEDWTQKKVSRIESQETVDDELMQQIADALNVPPAAIRNFDEEKALTNIQNNYDESKNSQVIYQFNPIDQITELYERMLKEKNAEIESLKKQLNEKK